MLLQGLEKGRNVSWESKRAARASFFKPPFPVSGTFSVSIENASDTVVDDFHANGPQRQ
jgi:hypothetical protein